MIPRRWLVHGSVLLLVALASSQLTSCGYIFYPERRGQTEGRIDAGVAILDACGLLFFIIPGVVAFAVDFASGAIYLPPGESRGLPPSMDEDGAVVVRILPEEMDQATVEAVVSDHVGRPVDLEAEGVRVYEADEGGRLKPRDRSTPIPFAPKAES